MIENYAVQVLASFKMKKYILVYLKSSAVFAGSFAVLFVIIYYGVSLSRYYNKRNALKAIKEKPVRNLKVVLEPHKYKYTVQTWVVPKYQRWLSPISWLKYTENCIFSGRLNAMKYAGMVPGHWSIKDFIEKSGGEKEFIKWELYSGKQYLSDKLLDKINLKINGNNNTKYEWVNIKSMDELIYLAKRGHHVFVYTQVWLGPSKRYPKPVKYKNMNYAHACTITGIKSYDPAENVIEFEIYETLPYNALTLTPVYSKVTKNGVNLFDRQSIPYIVRYGRKSRSGYIVKRRIRTKKKLKIRSFARI